MLYELDKAETATQHLVTHSLETNSSQLDTSRKIVDAPVSKWLSKLNMPVEGANNVLNEIDFSALDDPSKPPGQLMYSSTGQVTE